MTRTRLAAACRPLYEGHGAVYASGSRAVFEDSEWPGRTLNSDIAPACLERVRDATNYSTLQICYRAEALLRLGLRERLASPAPGRTEDE